MSANLHIAWARLLVAALRGAGVTRFVLSPGSRSTPLALAAFELSQGACDLVVDERSAAFFALGLSRAGAALPALVCTSGTAAAHYLPALIEASQSYVPLVVVTADRPWEAYDAAAPQTIDQVKLFGGFVRHHAEVGLPDEGDAALAAVARIAAQAAHAARHPTPGPVHLNARFRKPLEPRPGDPEGPAEQRARALAARGAPLVIEPGRALSRAQLAPVQALLDERPRALLVAGPATAAFDPGPVEAFAREAGLPLLAETPSGLRFGGDTAPVRCFDTLLRAAPRDAVTPDLVIELSSPPTSGAYASFIASLPATPRVVVAPHGHPDPHGTASAVIKATPSAFFEALTARRRAEGWLESWASLERVAGEETSRDALAEELSEASIAATVVASVAPSQQLVLGNSMPVRDVDTFGLEAQKRLLALHQRGAAGIDGMIAGAIGASLSGRGTVLFIGDVTAQHDLASLALARHAAAGVAVVMVNNDGGRIFESLPLGDVPGLGPQVEQLFVAPQRLSWGPIASAFGVRHEAPTRASELRQVIEASTARPGVTLIEARVPPHAGKQIRRALFARVRERLSRGER